MTITKLRPTFTFDQERVDALRAIAPEAFADGKINWEALREALGEHLEEEGREAEHFGLFWPGKREARPSAVASPWCAPRRWRPWRRAAQRWQAG